MVFQVERINFIYWPIEWLQELDLQRCSVLKELPSSIGQLNALQKLDLNEYSKLKELPSSIGQLNALQKLDLKGCSNLKEIPSSIGQLNALQRFYLWKCSNLKELPSSIGQLNDSNYIINKKTFFFQPTRFQLDVIFDYISIVFFWISKNIIHNFQINWTTYSFGGQMKAYSKYFEAHGIFLAPPWSTIEL